MVENDAWALLAVFLIPLGTAVLLMLVPSRERSLIIAITAASSLAMFAVSLYVFLAYDFSGDQFQGVQGRIVPQQGAGLDLAGVRIDFPAGLQHHPLAGHPCRRHR